MDYLTVAVALTGVPVAMKIAMFAVIIPVAYVAGVAVAAFGATSIVRALGYNMVDIKAVA